MQGYRQSVDIFILRALFSDSDIMNSSLLTYYLSTQPFLMSRPQGVGSEASSEWIAVVRLSPEGAYIHTVRESLRLCCQGQANESGGMAHCGESNCPPSVTPPCSSTVATYGR
ncbi:hypothetical protein NQZ68_033062 [Dissostichus eleginoides]|nr:hypothetical protein NQZ68_033062 [Dissostichus eleginoides]